MTDEFYPCRYEEYPNGNSAIYLPEQDSGLIVWFEEKASQGQVWHALIMSVAEMEDIDLSDAYIEPEGDVFVAYAPTAKSCVLKTLVDIIRALISKKSLMFKAAEHAENRGYFERLLRDL